MYECSGFSQSLPTFGSDSLFNFRNSSCYVVVSHCGFNLYFPFELWCWRRLLRVPWTARRSNQSILKEISPGCSLEGLMLWSWNSNTLATLCEELTHWKRLWCWEGLGAGGEGDDWGWDGWMASLTWWAWVWVNSGSWWWTGRPGVLWFMGSKRVRHDWVTELNWTELIQPTTNNDLISQDESL